MIICYSFRVIISTSTGIGHFLRVSCCPAPPLTHPTQLMLGLLRASLVQFRSFRLKNIHMVSDSRKRKVDTSFNEGTWGFVLFLDCYNIVDSGFLMYDVTAGIPRRTTRATSSKTTDATSLKQPALEHGKSKPPAAKAINTHVQCLDEVIGQTINVSQTKGTDEQDDDTLMGKSSFDKKTKSPDATELASSSTKPGAKQKKATVKAATKQDTAAPGKDYHSDYYLMKNEPDNFSIDDLEVEEGQTCNWGAGRPLVSFTLANTAFKN